MSCKSKALEKRINRVRNSRQKGKAQECRERAMKHMRAKYPELFEGGYG